MYNNFREFLLSIFGALIIAICLVSCSSTKNLGYFQDLSDSTKLGNIKLTTFVKPVIEPGDVLSITLLTVDQTAAASVNVGNLSATPSQTGATTQASDPSGYVVDHDGYVELLEIGRVKLSGLTIEQAREKIKTEALKYFKDPIVNIKNKNTKVTVLGEVGHAGVFNLATEKVTIVDVLGLAGDLTNFSDRENILLLRRNDNNTLSSIRLNLKSSETLRSPYFYLQNNDVIVVQPNKAKGLVTDAQFSRTVQLIGLATSLVSVILLIIKR